MSWTPLAGTSTAAVDDVPKDDDQREEELLQELRIASPGVQMLFGFLMTVPFNQRFQQLSSMQRGV